MRAAVDSPEAVEKLLVESDFDPTMFLPVDFASLGGAWVWLGETGEQGTANGPGGVVDDDPRWSRRGASTRPTFGCPPC